MSTPPLTAPFDPLAVLKGLAALRRLEPSLVVSAQFNPVRYVDWIVRGFPDAFVAGFGGGDAQEVPGARHVEPQLSLPDARPFDLVVTDYAMPGMTGLDLAAKIKRLRPHLPVIIATGYAELPPDARGARVPGHGRGRC